MSLIHRKNITNVTIMATDTADLLIVPSTKSGKFLQALSSDWFSVCLSVSDEVSGDLSGRLYHLEVMLKQLNNDLEKVSTRSTRT